MRKSILGIFALLLVAAALLSVATTQETQAIEQNVQATYGQNVKMQIGQILNVGDLNVELKTISSSVTESTNILNVYDTAGVVLSIDNTDAPPVKYSLKVGESTPFKGYVIELTDITPDSIGITVTLAPNLTQAQNTAAFNEEFKIQTGKEFTIGSMLKLKLNYVLRQGQLGGAGQGLAGITVTDISTAAEKAPIDIRFLSMPETQTYEDYSIIFTGRSNDTASFKVVWKGQSSTGTPMQTAPLGAKFEGSEGSTFRIGGIFDIGVVHVIGTAYGDAMPSASIKIDYIGPMIASSTAVPEGQEMTLAVGESKALVYNHEITLLNIDSDKAVFVIKEKRPVVVIGTGADSIDVISSDQTVTASQLTVQPGASTPDVRSASGVVNVEANSLQKGLDISVGQGQTVRVMTDPSKLETYIVDGNVTARTRTTLKGNAEGMFVQTDSADVKLKLLPATASENAFEVVGARFGNLTLEDVQGQIVYKGEADKEFLVLGFIPVNGHVSATINAETGAVTGIEKPWFAFISS